MNFVEERVSDSPVFFRRDHAEGRNIPEWWHRLKRVIDIVGGIVALTVCAPVLFLAAAAVVFASPGMPFFAQERVGKDGRRFKMFKLRTMVDGAHLLHEDLRHLNEVSGPVFKIRKDPRVHPIGNFLRRTSIDELPNFVNVVRGEMSLVGPRPPLASEVVHYDAFAKRRLTVKPGITCLWQISGRSNVSFDEWMKLDNAYIDTWTPWSDLLILARTLPAVCRKNGAH